MVVWIPDHHLNTGHLNTGEVKVIQIPTVDCRIFIETLVTVGFFINPFSRNSTIVQNLHDVICECSIRRHVKIFSNSNFCFQRQRKCTDAQLEAPACGLSRPQQFCCCFWNRNPEAAWADSARWQWTPNFRPVPSYGFWAWNGILLGRPAQQAWWLDPDWKGSRAHLWLRLDEWLVCEGYPGTTSFSSVMFTQCRRDLNTGHTQSWIHPKTALFSVWYSNAEIVHILYKGWVL